MLERRYGRAQFLKDAIALGLPVRLAFSRAALRRQRDMLMREHHPDRGGSDDKAQQINDTYARMLRWLDERHARGRGAQIDPDSNSRDEGQRATRTISPTLKKAAQVTVWFVSTVVSGYIAYRKIKKK